MEFILIPSAHPADLAVGRAEAGAKEREHHKLYCGSVEASVDLVFLENHRIRNVISLDPTEAETRKFIAEIYKIKLYPVYFLDKSNLEYRNKAEKVSNQVADLINQCLLQGNTLIHCLSGINRAPFCVCQFLIKYSFAAAQAAIDLLLKLNKEYRTLPCLFNPLFVEILGGFSPHVEQFKWLK